MSEQQSALENPVPGSTPAPDTGTGVGPYLRQVRENAGIHISVLAQALKVPVSRLEALEADRFDLMPDAAFARALTATICRMLQVDPVPVLARLPQRNAALPAGDARALSKGLPSMAHRKPSGIQQFPRPLLWGVALLLVGAGVLMLLPRDQMSVWMERFSHRADAGPASAPVASGEQSSSAAVATTIVPAEPVAAVEPTAPVAPVAAPAAAPTAAVADSDALLVLKAGNDTWIKVTDARGTVVLQKMFAAGEQQAVTASPPLAVVVGRADGTQVIVRGKPLDLAGIARNNVARFEVK